MFRTGHKLHLLLIYDFYIWFPHLWWLFAQCWNRFCVYIEMCHIWWPRCMEAGASSKHFAWLWRSDVITFCVLLMGPNSLLNFVIGVTYCCWWDRVALHTLYHWPWLMLAVYQYDWWLLVMTLIVHFALPSNSYVFIQFISYYE